MIRHVLIFNTPIQYTTDNIDSNIIKFLLNNYLKLTKKIEIQNSPIQGSIRFLIYHIYKQKLCTKDFQLQELYSHITEAMQLDILSKFRCIQNDDIKEIINKIDFICNELLTDDKTERPKRLEEYMIKYFTKRHESDIFDQQTITKIEKHIKNYDL